MSQTEIPKEPVAEAAGPSRRKMLWLAGAAVLATGTGALVATAFARDMAAAQRRIAGGRSLAQSRYGPIEYASAGNGPPVLMVHGSGGGFDQGLAFAQGLVTRGYQVIAPSRFGYLFSSAPAEPTPEHQADAFADLLDALSIKRLPVLGGSAGALSALAFAIRHPQRCSALVPIVPAAYAPSRPAAQTPSPLIAFVQNKVLRSDFLYWLALNTTPRVLMSAVLATDPSLIDQASEAERARAWRILNDILPISARTAGLVIDAAATANAAPMPLERIVAPTLTISLEDDRFGTLAAARHIAVTVPGARLLSWPIGGHIWIGHEVELFDAVAAFLKEHGHG